MSFGNMASNAGMGVKQGTGRFTGTGCQVETGKTVPIAEHDLALRNTSPKDRDNGRFIFLNPGQVVITRPKCRGLKNKILDFRRRLSLVRTIHMSKSVKKIKTLEVWYV